MHLHTLPHSAALLLPTRIHITIFRIFVFVVWNTLIQTVSVIHFKIFNLFLLSSFPHPITVRLYSMCDLYLLVSWCVKVAIYSQCFCFIFQSLIFIMIFYNWVSPCCWVLRKLQCKSYKMAFQSSWRTVTLSIMNDCKSSIHFFWILFMFIRFIKHLSRDGYWRRLWFYYPFDMQLKFHIRHKCKRNRTVLLFECIRLKMNENHR